MAHLLREGQRLPDVLLASMGGTAVPFSSFRGRKVLLFFWAPWDSSREALSALQRFYEHHRSGTFEVVTIAFDVRGPESPMKDLKGVKASFTLLIDATCTLSRVWGVRTIPLAALVDEEGTVVLSSDTLDEGFLSRVSCALQEGVRKLLSHDPKVEHRSESEILLQACANFLGRGMRQEALASLKKALSCDSDNSLIARQIEVIEPQ